MSPPRAPGPRCCARSEGGASHALGGGRGLRGSRGERWEHRVFRQLRGHEKNIHCVGKRTTVSSVLWPKLNIIRWLRMRSSNNGAIIQDSCKKKFIWPGKKTGDTNATDKEQTGPMCRHSDGLLGTAISLGRPMRLMCLLRGRCGSIKSLGQKENSNPEQKKHPSDRSHLYRSALEPKTNQRNQCPTGNGCVCGGLCVFAGNVLWRG